MNVKRLLDPVVAVEKLAPATAATTSGQLAALGPMLALLPKLVPFVARAVRRHPAQAVVSLIGLALLARQLQRHSREDSVDETPLLR